MIEPEKSGKDLLIQNESQRNIPEFFRNDFKNLISEEELRKYLASIIKNYLKNRMNELMNIFYRIDLNENSINDAFALDSEEAIAEQLAYLVIKRQKQKILLRQKFKDQA